MLSLIDPTTIPPGGLKYIQKETNTTLTAASMPELLDKVRRHRLGNNLPIPNEWKQEIEDSLCQTMPVGICRHTIKPTEDWLLPNAHRPLRMAELLSGARVLGSWMFSGFQKVEQEEADRRSRICAACPFNQEDGGCTICAKAALSEAVQSVIGNVRSVAHDVLKSCTICGCTLKLAVWTPLDLILKNSPQTAQQPSWCWKAKTE